MPKYVYEGQESGHPWRLDCILGGQEDRRLVWNIPVQPDIKSDHPLVSAHICLR